MYSEATVSIIGNIGTITNRGEDNKVTVLSVAVNENYKDKDGNPVENTTWINCTLFKNNAAFAQKYLSVGRYVRINAHLVNNEWTDDDGKKRFDLEVIVDRISALDPKPED